MAKEEAPPILFRKYVILAIGILFYAGMPLIGMGGSTMLPVFSRTDGVLPYGS